MRHKPLIIAALSLLAVFLGLVLLAGCGENPAEKKGKPVIRVGYSPNITHAQALTGFGDGTFQQALGDSAVIEEHRFNAGPAGTEALLAGSIDLAYIGPVPAINGYVKSKGQIKIIAGGSTGGTVLVARRGANIAGVKDLDGKKVAVPQLGNTQDILLRSLLAKANLKDAAGGGSVTVIPAANPDMPALMDRGDIDAALVPEPWGSILVEQAGAGIVLGADEIWPAGNYATTVLVVNTGFLNSNPKLVEKWLAAHIDITERFNRDREGSKALVKSRLKELTRQELPEYIVTRSLVAIEVTNDPEAGSIRQFARVLADSGYLKKEPDISQLVNLEPINRVLKQKGLPLIKGF